jgi:Rab GDP dissociation inhibitor
MANGLLVKMLLHTKVTRYLEWKTIDCSYVMQHTSGGMFSSAANKIHKVPANESEAIRSNLMGLFQKKKCRNFYLYMDRVNLEDQATWENKNLNTMTMGQVFESFGLDQQTTDFLGHAVALHIEDGYL